MFIYEKSFIRHSFVIHFSSIINIVICRITTHLDNDWFLCLKYLKPQCWFLVFLINNWFISLFHTTYETFKSPMSWTTIHINCKLIIYFKHMQWMQGAYALKRTYALLPLLLVWCYQINNLHCHYLTYMVKTYLLGSSHCNMSCKKIKPNNCA
jgi:hypothetical protein